jgi:hypothetical protein
VADREVGDDLQPVTRGIEEVGVDRHRRVGDQRGGALDQVEQPRPRHVQSALAELEALLERSPSGREQDPGDHDHWTIVSHSRGTLTVTVM